MYGFNLFSFIFPLFFIAFFCLFIFTALIVSKRASVSHHNHHDSMSTSSTKYYVTFEFSNGERIELKLSGREYGLLAEGDRGILSFQGSRFISFERK